MFSERLLAVEYCGKGTLLLSNAFVEEGKGNNTVPNLLSSL